MMKFVILACALLAATPVLADEGGSVPYQLYRDGQYDAAIKAGIAAGDGEGYLQAAHAELAKAHMAASPCMPCLKTAEGYARKAIALDPASAEAYVYLATALGYEARILGLIEAKAKGLPGEAADDLKTALKLKPADPYALAAMGGWNIGVVNAGGSMLASMIYGATMDKGLEFYRKSFAAAPDYLVPRFQYVISLSSEDREEYAKEITSSLEFVINGHARTAYERFMQGQARTLLALWQKGDWTAYKALIRKIQGYPDN